MPFLTQGKANWKFIAIVAVLAVIVGIGLWFLFGLETEKIAEDKSANWQVCSADSDCIVVDSDCCGCSSGGTATTINKNFKEEWENKLLGECREAVCLEVESDDPSCFKEPRCIDNTCQLVDKTADWQTYRNEEIGIEIGYPEGFFHYYFEAPEIRIYDCGYSDSDFCSNPKVVNDISICVDYNLYEHIAGEIDGYITYTILKDGECLDLSFPDIEDDCPYLYLYGRSTEKSYKECVNQNAIRLEIIKHKIPSTFRFIGPSNPNFNFIGKDAETGWNVGRSDNYNFEIKYPSLIFPSAEFPASSQLGSWSYWGGYDDKGEATGEIIARFTTCQLGGPLGQNFNSEFRIGASSNPDEVKDCFNIWNIIPVKVDINGQEFRRFESADAAAGFRSSEDVYRTIHNNVCFSIEKLEYGYRYTEVEYPDSPQHDYEYSQKYNSCRDTLDQMLSTFRFIEETTPIPVIDSISPNSGPVGTVIEIRGDHFAGFEGDLDAWIENADGTKGYIYCGNNLGENQGSNNNLLKFVLEPSYFNCNSSYSGLPCSGFLSVVPGVYKIYVYPWGIKSNEVNFTVTSSR